jgi:pyrroloquinoline quinone biosynthesis protein D
MPQQVKLTHDDRVEINPMYLFRWEESQDAHVLLYPEGVVKLNATAGEILKRCTPEKTIGTLIEELESVFVDGDVANGVLKFLEVSHAKGWIRRQS